MNLEELDLESWVTEAPNAANQEFREAVHTILSAISNDPELKASMILKGGILLAIRYKSHRFTKDIDLSTTKTLDQEFTTDEITDRLDQSLDVTVETLGYDLDCTIQSAKKQPKDPETTHPSLRITVGYAYKGTRKHKKLTNKQSPAVISIDYSLNEVTPNIDNVRLTSDDGSELLVYSLTDLIAEKYRSLLQQIVRNRSRRQDIFDLFLILSEYPDIDDVEKTKILESLIEKSHAREIYPNKDSFGYPEIKNRAQKHYHTLSQEVEGELPGFEESFQKVAKFYKSLPWNDE